MSEEVLATGRFRVDRKRALEKMEKFQLADPLAYTLELVAAAVAGGATRIAIENDSDDFVIAWDGAGPERDELDGLFDHLFGGASGPRATLLQHLAMGVLGALGQAPKWVHVDRPGLRLAVTDPTETQAVEHVHAAFPDGATTRVHVRQRWSVANVAEALLLPLHGAPEARLVRDRARWCPVPLTLDGKPIERPKPPLAFAESATLWLVEGPARVDIVRHGIVVGALERGIGGLGVFGWLPGDAVNLDASRAEIVRDKAFEALERALDDAVTALLAAFAATAGPRLVALDEARTPDDALRAQLRAAAAWLATRRRPLGDYATLPLLRDLDGRAWSIDGLKAHTGQKGTVADPALAEPGLALFLLADSATLDVLVPKLPDLTALLRTRAEGRERRRQAEQARRLPPEFGPSTHQRRFADGPLQGAVRFDAGVGTSVRLSLRIGGVEVEETTLPSPAGAMVAIADHPGFTPDDAFKAVKADAVRAAAEARVLAEAAAFALDHVERIARGAALGPPAVVVVTAALRAAGAKARADLAAILASRPDDRLLRAPAFPVGDGRRLGLPDLLAGEWVVVESLPRDCAAELAARVLVLPPDHAPTWLGWLGKRARDGRATLEAEILGAKRRAGPKREAKLGGGALRVPIPGRTGEIGLDRGDAQARIDLLRDGVPVCTVPLDLGMPGLVGVVDDPTFTVTPAHDALADAQALPRLAKDLAPAVDALARALWDAAPAIPGRELPTRLLAWLRARAQALPDWCVDRPLAHAVDGTPLTVGALRARNTDKRLTRFKLVSTRPGDVPGFDDAFVVGDDLKKTLEAIGGRAVRDADPDRASAVTALLRFLERPAAPTPPILAERVEEKDGVRCRWVLPRDPDRVGVLKVEARWRERVLSTWERGESLGLLGLLEGDAVQPNAGLTMLRDPNVLTPWYRHARSRFDEVLRQALDERFPDGDAAPPAAERATWRAILARLDGASDRHKAETTLRDRIAALPLFTRLDGAVVSRDAIAAALDVGVVHTVPEATPPGPTDTDWYVREEPWTARALGVLASRITPGGTNLAAWREGEARRVALVPREARVTGETLARAPLKESGLHGEIALVPATEGHADGLLVHPLVDGRPLDTLRVPFPAPAVAVVTGANVRPDRAFRAWEGAAAARPALVEAARALAATLPLEGAPARDWLVRYGLGDLPADGPPGPGADRPVFPLLGGGTASARDLAARAALGGVGVVDPMVRQPFVCGAAPVLAPLWMRDRIAARFPLADLAPVVERHRAWSPPSVPAHAVDVPEGRVAWSLDTDAVQVFRDGVLLATVPAGGVVPLVGYVTSATAEVDPLWTRLLPGADTDALRARLVDLSRVVLARLLDALPNGFPHANEGLRALVARALERTLAGIPDEKTLRAAPAGDLLGRLLAAPLFVDVEDAPGSFLDLLARPNVRWVEPGVTGRALPSRGRVWRLTEADRALVRRFRPLVDAAGVLPAETAGIERRVRARCEPPVPPSGVPSVPLGGTVTGALWLLDDRSNAAGVDVRVDGARVTRLATRVPGLAGWVVGSFDTDDAFTSVTLPESAHVALRGAAAELLQQEAAVAPDRVRARVSTALAAASHDHDVLLDDPTSPWELVPLFVDTSGDTVDLRALVRLKKGGKRILVGPEGSVGTRRGERVVRGDTDVLATLRSWFPDTVVEHVTEAQERALEKKREEEAKRREGARSKREKAFVERAGRLWRAWCGVAPPDGAIEAEVTRWARGDAPGWPPILDADLEGPWAALLAFAAEPAEDVPAQRIARVAGLAKVLGG